jgi:D-alanine-D-alanine ligase
MGAADYNTISDPADFGKVAVLMGGKSAEREISLLSGEAVLNGLLASRVDAHRVDVGDDIVDVLRDGKFDRVFNALHGRGGEDGTLQGMLETLRLPYTGSGVAASALAMDKLRTKQLLKGAGLPTAEWWVLKSESDCRRLARQLSYPLITKPALEGSSIGMTKVNDATELLPAFQAAAVCGTVVLAERWIDGPEFTIAILNGLALPMIRIVTDNTFYDYEAKYFSDDTQYVCPAGVDGAVEEQYARIALDVWAAVGGEGWGRVDLMVDGETREPLVLEVNTVPGMTSHSLVPMAAAEAGIGFEALVWRILETSFVKRDSAQHVVPTIGNKGKGNAA